MTSTKTRAAKIATVIIPVAHQDRQIEFYVEELQYHDPYERELNQVAGATDRARHYRDL